MIAIAATIAAAIAGGIWSERRWGAAAERTARGVLRAMLLVFSPFVIFFNIAHLHVDVNVGGGIGLAYVAVGTTGLVAYVVASRGLRLRRAETGALTLAAIQPNTGYLGLPLTVALLGASHLSEAAAYDSLVQAPVLLLAGFGIGAAFGDNAGETPRERARSFLSRNTPLLAAVAGLLAPKSLAPQSLVDVSRVLVFAQLPMGFFAVGVTLAADADHGAVPFPPPLSRSVAVAIGLRLVLAPLMLTLLALPLIDLPSSYLLLSAMPCGIGTLMVAHAYGLDLRLSASAVAWSTSIVVVAGLIAGYA